MFTTFRTLVPVLTLLIAGASAASAGLSPEHRATSSSPPERHRPSRDNGAGAGSFDGRWMLTGVSTNCQGSGSGAFRVSGTRVAVTGGGGGHVSPSGAFRASTVVDGVRLTVTGRLSGSKGAGSYRRSDGCVGRWTAARQ